MKKDGIGSAADKRAGVEILCIKEEIQRLKTHLKWVSSERMLADPLTKLSSRQNMIDMMKSGRLCLVQDETYTAAKKKDKKQRQASAAKTFGYGSHVASRIASVIALDHVTKTEGMNVTEDILEESYFLDYAMIVTIFAVFVGVIFLVRVSYKSAAAWMQDLLAQRRRFRAMIGILEKELKEANERRVHAEEMLEFQIEENERMTQDFDVRVRRARRETLQNDRLILRVRSGMQYYTTGGHKLHMYRDCQALQQSRDVRAKDGYCTYCWDRLRNQTANGTEADDQ